MTKYIFLSLRPRHWIKNMFIFLPLIFGRKLFILSAILKATAAFFLFSMAAAAAYLINDIVDLEKDKLDPTKGLRPIASGKVGIKQALATSLVLIILSVTFSFILNVYLGWVIIAYLLLNFIYTKILKEIVIIDAFCISSFFLLRIIAGSVIEDIIPSHWLIFMTALLALFLAFIKRRQELKLFETNAVIHRQVLIKYNAYFIDQMIAVIMSSIVAVYMLYTIDRRTVAELGSNHLIYSIPFVYYGIFRYLYLVHRHGKGEDPTLILFSDTKMQINLILWIIVCIAVIYFRP